MRFWNPIKWIGSHWQLLRKCVAWAAVLVLSVVAVIAIGWYPIWQARSVTDPHDQERLELENRLRLTVAQIVGGAAVLVGVYLALRRVKAAEDQVRIARDGQVTERFTRAIEQLGSNKLEVRLGGIYALERIARDSERDHWPIMEVLTAYVREHAKWPPRRPPDWESIPEDERALVKPDPDVQSILTVIGRRARTWGKGEDKRIDLCNTNLRRADLCEAHLEGAMLNMAHLEGASIEKGAHLEKAWLAVAHLEDAYLNDAHLEGAVLISAWMRGATLTGTHLDETLLGRADMRSAQGLTPQQVSVAIIDDQTLLPDSLMGQVPTRPSS